MYSRHNRLMYCTAVILGTFLMPAAEAGTLVVANKAEATASLIDLDSGDVIATLPTGEGPHEVGISPAGRFALVTNYGRRDASGESLTMIDISAARVVKTIMLDRYKRPHGVEWLDESRAIVTVEENKAVIIVDVDTGKVIESFSTDQATSHMVALGPAVRRAYIANIGSGSVSIIDLETGALVRNVTTGEGAEGIAVAASGRYLWVTNRAADTVSVLDTESLENVADFPSQGFPIRATATPGGEILVTRARAGDLVIYDAEDFGTIRTVDFDLTSMDAEERLFGDRFGDSSVPIGVVVDNAGNRAFVAHANADVITEIDIETGKIVRMLRAGREPDGMGYSAVKSRH